MTPSKPPRKKQQRSQPDRRTENREAPTQMMKSYLDMGQENRRFMRKLGIACWSFVALLVTGGILVKTFTEDELSMVMWTFVFLVFFVGLLLIWPQALVYTAERAPKFIVSILPTKISSLWEKAPDRRKESK